MARQHTTTRPHERTVRTQFEVSRLAATHLRDAYAHVVAQPRWSRQERDRGLGLAADGLPLRRRSGGQP
jgi:hypothetical protein